MSDSVLAWHFSDGELRFDYTGVKVEAGLVLEAGGKPIAETNGFHASIRALDALRWYAVRSQTAFIISRVRLSGEIVEEKQRLIAQRREHIWVADARPVLREFAAEQRLYLEEIHQSAVDLRLKIYQWIYPDWRGFERLKDTQKFEKELAAVPLRPLGNQVMDYTDQIHRLENEFYHMRMWEKAKEANFDLEAYLELNYEEYGLIDWFGYLDNEIPLIEAENYERGRWWALENPPQEFASFLKAPKDPNDLFHEMLMRLAPEGYGE